MKFQACILRMAGVLAWAAVGVGARGVLADVPPDLEAQYLAAVGQLKNPATTGVLVTEVDPDSAVAGSGLHAGDIFTEYNGAHIRTLRDLRAQVAEVVGQRAVDDSALGNVLARVRRGDKDVLLSLPREALGIRAVEVEGGVSRDRNPPPDRPGELVLDWAGVLKTLNDDNAAAHGGAARMAFRMIERLEPDDAAAAADAVATQPATQPADVPPPVPRETWVGWQVVTAEVAGKDLVGHVDIRHLVLPESGPLRVETEPSSAGFRLRDLGDYKTSAACVLAGASSMYQGRDDLYVNATATRQADRLNIGVKLSPQPAPPAGAGDSGQETVEVPLDAISQCAVPWLAAALPQKADAAIGLHLLSVRKFVARPGYVLVTRGRAAVPGDPEDGPATQPAGALPWRVDLMHCGVIVESYWFTDQRRLVEVESMGVPEIILRRVDSEKQASLPLVRGGAAGAATDPSTTTAP